MYKRNKFCKYNRYTYNQLKCKFKILNNNKYQNKNKIVN